VENRLDPPDLCEQWIRVREDIAQMPDGYRTIYGVIEARPAVGILPFVDEDTVLLVGQYRYVFGRFFWEIPTGAQEADETELDAVGRELAEETGYLVRHVDKVCTFQSSKSVLDEIAHVYIATGLVAAPGPHRVDATEFIELRTFPFAEVVRMVERNEIQDAITIIAVLHAARRRTH
jgi:ADP-ribose pyrophosphatase